VAPEGGVAFELGSWLMKYWDLVLLLATWTGIAFVALRRRRDWRRKRFTQQVSFSLTYLETDAEGRERLALRTLLELNAAEVWLNEYGVRRVEKAAERTTLEDPFLRIEPPEDQELVRHAVLNVLAERYSEAFLARAMGLDVRMQTFLFGVTWERYGDIKTHKLRVMVVRPEELEALFGPQGRAKRLGFASESHRWRLATLEHMYRLHRSSDPAEQARLGALELGVVRDAAR
jgi:hypothetical protein